MLVGMPPISKRSKTALLKKPSGSNKFQKKEIPIIPGKKFSDLGAVYRRSPGNILIFHRQKCVIARIGDL